MLVLVPKACFCFAFKHGGVKDDRVLPQGLHMGPLPTEKLEVRGNNLTELCTICIVAPSVLSVKLSHLIFK